MKKLLFIIVLCMPFVAFGQIQQINLGSAADDGTGDDLRSGGTKINANFNYLDGLVTDTTELADIAYRKSDTTTQMVFVCGHGAAGDTVNFDDGYIIGSLLHPSTADTIVVTSLQGVIQGSSRTIDVQLKHGSSLASLTDLHTSDFTITSTTTGNSTSTFTNEEINPGSRVVLYCEDVSYTTKPTYLEVTVIGYRK